MIDRDDQPDPGGDATEVTRREGHARADSDADDAGATKREGQVSGERPLRASASEAAPDPERLTRGTLVGRYVILDVLGEGGMGVVYGAFDPELDRKVAIKLLQINPGGSGSGDQAWLVREAQALARLSHPNVVAVHDVGTLPGDRVFVAMELVDGLTLRAWLKATPRTWREVLPVMRAAGAGLAAAHDAGLVHRDFKPDNVIVGNDGRVRVMDFGLARLRPDDTEAPPTRSSDLQLEARSPLSEKLTIAGAVVGTPAYMAPEIYQGASANAGTDQFAFGVALYEALFRARPYDKKDLTPPLSAARPKTPPDTGVPAKIQRVVLRAIQLEPAQRYSTMNALLAELAVDPFAGRRRALLVAGIAATGIAVAGGVYATRTRAPEPCQGIDQRLSGVWDAKARDAVHASFLASKKTFAETSFAGLSRALDGYTQGWTTTVIESCKATRVRREQTEDVLTLRQGCLDQRLEEVRALVAILRAADGGLVEKGDKVVFELDPVAACSNVTALREPGLPPPELRDKVTELNTKLAESKARLIAGQYLDALVASQQAVDGAKKIGWQPLVAEALELNALGLMTAGNFQEAAKTLADATYTAIQAKRDDIAADAGLTTAMVVADGLGRPEEARIWLGHAVAAANRIGVDRMFDRRRLEVEGLIDAYAGDFNSAIAAHEKSLGLASAEFGADNPGLITEELTLASTMSRAGMYAKGAGHFEHALALREASVGHDHPDVAAILSNLGACYGHMGEIAKARAALQRSLSIREGYYGKKSPLLIATLDNFGEVLRKQGDVAAAIEYQERAMAMARIVPGTAHMMYHQLATDYADTLIVAGRNKDAHALFEAVLVLEEQNHSSVLPATQASRAELALAEAAWGDAATFAEKSIASYEGAGGKDNPVLWRPLTDLARARIGQHRVAEARPLLERAIAIAEHNHITPEDLAPTRTALSGLPKP